MFWFWGFVAPSPSSCLFLILEMWVLWWGSLGRIPFCVFLAPFGLNMGDVGDDGSSFLVASSTISRPSCVLPVLQCGRGALQGISVLLGGLQHDPA